MPPNETLTPDSLRSDAGERTHWPVAELAAPSTHPRRSLYAAVATRDRTCRGPHAFNGGRPLGGDLAPHLSSAAAGRFLVEKDRTCVDMLSN
jgi:hypothetical protein